MTTTLVIFRFISISIFVGALGQKNLPLHADSLQLVQLGAAKLSTDRKQQANSTTGVRLEASAFASGTGLREDGWLTCELRDAECEQCQARAGKSESQGTHSGAFLLREHTTGFQDLNHVIKALDGWTTPMNARSGEIWLVKTDDVHIQGRGCVSSDFRGKGEGQGAISAVAVGGPFLKGHVLVAEALTGNVLIDDEPVIEGRAIFTSDYELRVVESGFDKKGRKYSDVMAWLPKSTTLYFRRYENHIDAKIYLSKEEFGIDVDDLGGLEGRCNSRVDFDRHVAPEQILFKQPVQHDEVGFLAVQSQPLHFRMHNFVRQLIKARKATLLNERALEAQVPFYSGEKDKRSYKALLKALRKAKWVRGFKDTM